jgi:acyl carrier protein
MPAETHVGQSSTSAEEVLALVQEHLAEILEIDESTIGRTSRFAEDLDADSLALIELVEVLEDELGERTVGFRVDDEDLADLHTVGETVDYVMARLAAAGGSMPGAETPGAETHDDEMRGDG